MKPYYEDASCTIYHGDAREVLWDRAPVGDLCAFDPPYNVGKAYDGYDDALDPAEYRFFLWDLLRKIDARTLTWFPGALNTLTLLPLLEQTDWVGSRSCGRPAARSCTTRSSVRGAATCWS